MNKQVVCVGGGLGLSRNVYTLKPNIYLNSLGEQKENPFRGAESWKSKNKKSFKKK